MEGGKMGDSRISKDEYFLSMAKLVSRRSTCARRRVGCVLVNYKNHVLATGYNGVAASEPHCIEKPCPGAKYKTGKGLDKCEAIHAEQNAILQCRNVGSIIAAYVTTAPCVTCTKLLMNTGCKRIIFIEDYKASGKKLFKGEWKQYESINNVFTQIIMESTKRLT